MMIKNMTPKVSILIPVYNSESYVEETLSSILNQSYNNIEIILVDDGSTDDSYSIIKKYESDNVKIFKQENSGACKARNYAFELSSGDFIQYLDADDLLSEDFVLNKVNYFLKYGKNIIVTSVIKRFYNSIYNSNKISTKINKNYQEGKSLIIDMAKYQQPSQVSSWMISRDLQLKSGKWNEELLRNQDGEMFIRLLLNCDGVYCSLNSTSFYRIVTNSISSDFSKDKINSLFTSYDSYRLNILNHFDTSEAKLAIQRFYLSILLIHNKFDKELYYKTNDRIKDFNIRPSFGGVFLIRVFSCLFGIKFSLHLIYLIKKLKNR